LEAVMRLFGPVYAQPEPFQRGRISRLFQPYAIGLGTSMPQKTQIDKIIITLIRHLSPAS
jgi:hypothetical protein